MKLGRGIIQCDFCGQGFPTATPSFVHFLRCHAARPSELRAKRRYDEHLTAQRRGHRSRRDSVGCDDCGLPFPAARKPHLIKHIAHWHGSTSLPYLRDWVCDHCGVAKADKVQLQNHIALLHPADSLIVKPKCPMFETKIKVQCDSCDWRGERRVLARKHWPSKHTASQPVPLVRPAPCVCDDCLRTLSSAAAMLHHVARHLGRPRTVQRPSEQSLPDCDDCPRRLKGVRLWRHWLYQHSVLSAERVRSLGYDSPGRRRKLVCDECGKSVLRSAAAFHAARHLDPSLRRRTRKSPRSCDGCQGQWKERAIFISHLSRCTGKTLKM